MEITTRKDFSDRLNWKKIIDNEEIKEKYATKNNYESHLKKNQIFIGDIKKDDVSKNMEPNQLKHHQTAFGYTKEDISFFVNDGLFPGQLKRSARKVRSWSL